MLAREISITRRDFFARGPLFIGSGQEDSRVHPSRLATTLALLGLVGAAACSPAAPAAPPAAAPTSVSSSAPTSAPATSAQTSTTTAPASSNAAAASGSNLGSRTLIIDNAYSFTTK